MTYKITTTLGIVFSCFALLFLIACGDDGDVIVQAPTDPSPVCGDDICEAGENADNCSADCGQAVSVSIVGTCRGGSTSVTCEDASTSSPAGHIEKVSFVLRSSTGSSVSTGQISGGCGTAPVPCEVLFPGLSGGTYSVEHSVKPDDGGASAQRTYTDLIVTGGV